MLHQDLDQEGSRKAGSSGTEPVRPVMSTSEEKDRKAVLLFQVK